MVTGDWRQADAERRAMGTAGASGGQFLLPQPLAAQVIDLARARSVAVMLGATTIPMESKELDIAVVTGDPTAYWTAEGAPITESDMTFGRRSLRSYPLAILTRASLELVQDAPNAGQVIETAIAAALGLALDTALLYGTGALQPAGLRGWSGLNEISMGTNGAAITDFAKFVEAIQKVLEGNGPDPEQLGVAMSPREFATVEKFEDTTGQPLRPPQSYEVMRRRVSMQIKTDEVQGSASNAATLFIGDWRELLLGLRNEIAVEASATAGTAFQQRQILIRGTLRADSVVGRDKWLTRVIGIIP